MTEIWRVIDEYPTYMVSNHGRVLSLDKETVCKSGQIRHTKGKMLKPKGGGENWYFRVELWNESGHKTQLIHRLVALAFVDGAGEGKEVNHKDGNKQNNNADNLEWVTRKENVQHAFRIGLNSNPIACTLRDPCGAVYCFDSLKDACSFLGRDKGYIRKMLNADGKIRDLNKTEYTVEVIK